MAQNLNQTRMRDSRLLVLFSILVILCTNSLIGPDELTHEILEYLGSFLVAVCALGRVYTTAFLGGHKNQTLITHGPFSVVRNPLYFLSFIGMCGIAMISGYLILMIVLPLGFFFLYHFLIQREEGFLRESFGQAYTDYCAKTPRFFPNFKLYNVPETTILVPDYLKKAYADAIWWFLAWPACELIEWMVEQGLLNPLITMP